MRIGPLLGALVEFYIWLIIIYVILSWFRPEGGFLGDVYRVISSVVDPFLAIFRKIVPVVNVGAGALDLSPIVAILVLELVVSLLNRL